MRFFYPFLNFVGTSRKYISHIFLSKKVISSVVLINEQYYCINDAGMYMYQPKMPFCINHDNFLVWLLQVVEHKSD